MKTLVEYIKEAQELDVEIQEEKKEDASVSKTFNFNFANLEGAEDMIKSLQEMEAEGFTISVDENKVEITVTDANAADGLFEMLQDYVHKRRQDQKVASSEPYAQSVAKFEKVVASYYSWVDELAAASEEDDKDDDKDDDKKEEE